MSGARAARATAPVWAAALTLAVASAAIRWPGVAVYDSVDQYRQVLDGEFNDWHPPIMARLWALLVHLHAGTAPFFLLQLLCWWGGLGLLAAALVRGGRRAAAAAVLAIGAWPLFLGWTTVVVKDAQLACCLVAVAGIIGWWRRGGRPLPRRAWAAILPLAGYATLVRGNAVFATVPFVLALTGWGGLTRWWARAGVAVGLMLGVIALAPAINHRLLRAEESHIDHALMIYDLAGIGHRAGLATLAGVPPAMWRAAEARGCYTSFYWDPYGTPTLCDAVGQAVGFAADAPPHLAGRWAGAILHHPVAYATHRIGHLNANLRGWIGPGEPGATPPIASERNAYGLGATGGRASGWLIGLAATLEATPFGWPCIWLAGAVALLWASAGAVGERAALGRALALSAACMSASFAVVSIASDLRYHLWSMVAVALATVLLADARAIDRRRGVIAGGLVAALSAAAILGRLGLAAPVAVPHAL